MTPPHGPRLGDRLDRAVVVLIPVLALVLPVTRRGATVVASLILLLWIVGGRWRERWAVTRSSPLLLAMLAFLALSVLSLAWSEDLAGGLDYLAKYRYLLLAAVVATTLPSARVGRVVDALLAGVALSLVWSFALAAGLVHFGHGYPEHPAPSMNHLDYSMFLAVAGLLALARLLRSPRALRPRALWAALTLACVAGLLVNIGRSGQLAFFVGLTALLAHHLPGPRLLRPAAALALTAALLAAAYLAVPIFRDRADAALDEVELALVHGEYSTNQGKRIASWIASAEVLRTHPVLGVGVGDAVDEFHRTVREHYPQLEEAVRDYRHLHNQYLQVGVELGLVGLLALLTLLVTLLRSRTGQPALDDVARVVGWVYLVGCVGDPFLHKQLPLALFALLGGLLVAGGREGADAPHDVAPLPRGDGADGPEEP